MRNYKKALLALSVMAALPLMAATADETIYVTTLADEDGENANACSLREAITAAAQNRPYGGCTAGKSSSSVTDDIQLKEGVYELKKPLTPTSMVRIMGKVATTWDSKDAVTGTYPERLPLQTVIKGNNSFTLFDATGSKSVLNLQNMVLTDGRAKAVAATDGRITDGRGGAIKAGGVVNLNRVEIRNSTADAMGGAIYLSGVGSSVNMVDSTIQNNIAPKGAVLAMSCWDGTVLTERNISLQNSSIVENGNARTESVLEFCGIPKVEIQASTIAHNTALTARNFEQLAQHPDSITQIPSSIIKFTSDNRPNEKEDTFILSPSNSGLTLLSNTIVNNTAETTLLYDSVGNKTLSYNIIAYNNGNYSCRHLLGALGSSERASISSKYNGLIKNGQQPSFCDIPYATLNDNTSVDLSNTSQSNIMVYRGTDEASQKYTGFMPMYFLINAKTNPLVDIKPDPSKDCSSTDQRGVTRLVTNQLLLDKETENSCEIGSTELVRLAVQDISGTNVSQVTTLERYESDKKIFQERIDNPNTDQQYLKYFQIRVDELDKKIKDFTAKAKYRAAYFDIFTNSTAHEIETSDGTRSIQHLDASLYKVEPVVIGVGTDVLSSNNIEDLEDLKQALEPDAKLKCAWDEDLQQLVVYHENVGALQSADYAYCTYKVSLKSDLSVHSTGLVQAKFTNIAPIAKEHSYTMKWGTDQRVKLDLLNPEHYNDDGDGKFGQSNYPTDKSPYYTYQLLSSDPDYAKYPDGKVIAPIKIEDFDFGNLILDAQYKYPCPDESRATCYGGDIYVQPKNNFNKFNYKFKYQVFDEGATLSNVVEVKLINTATTTDDTRGAKETPRSVDHSGGGSFGVFSIFALAGLAWLRRKKS